MKSILTVLLITFLLVAQEIPVQAQTPVQKTNPSGTKVAGALLVLGGSGLVIGAFNYGASCPEGYTTHTFQGLPTQCVYVSSYGSDVRQASSYADLQRPRLLYAGAAALGTGVILLLLPKKAEKVTRNLDIAIAPKGWRASKTIQW